MIVGPDSLLVRVLTCAAFDAVFLLPFVLWLAWPSITAHIAAWVARRGGGAECK